MRWLWHCLPFAGRLFVTASIALLSAGIVMVAVSARQDAQDAHHDLQQVLAQELETMPDALAEVVVLGDFATLQQTLNHYVARPLVIEAHFNDPTATHLASHDTEPGGAPDWFLHFFAYHDEQGATPVTVGGREYGTFGLKLSPNRLALRAWQRLLKHMAILFLAVGMDFIGIWLVLRFGLRPLKQLEKATAELADGRLDTRLEETGSPELRHLIQCFNVMADALQTSAEQVRSSEERLQLAINGVNDGIWDWDLRTDAIYFSPKWKQMLGYDERELAGTLDTFRALLHPEDAPKVFAMISDYIRGIIPTFAIEFRMKRKEGDWCWILGRGAVVRDMLGRPYRMAGSHTDISERKHMEDELLRARETAEAANQAKTAFLANMSHELRTPLNAILGFAQILEQSEHLTEQHKRQVNGIYRGGQYLLTLINDILDLTKVEAGRFEIHTEEVIMETFFQEIEKMFQIRAEAKDIAFVLHGAAELPYCLATDPKRLRQIVINLLGNAVKFTERGRIDLRVEYVDNELRLSVNDTGPGIPHDQHEEVFKPFVQLGDYYYKSQGSGLGLAITRNIVEAMDGTIDLHSEMHQGSCFQVTLPVELCFDTVKPTEPVIAQILGYQSPVGVLRLLIVDDIPDNLEILGNQLKPLGFEVREAGSGQECLRIAPQWRPHGVLMDMRMPGMDGLETTRRLRALAEMRDVPVIAVSAGAFHEDVLASRDAGCTAYLVKPFKRELLLQTLQAHLPLTWATAEQRQECPPDTPLSTEQRGTLLAMAKRGDVSQVMNYLKTLMQAPDCPGQAHVLLGLAKRFQLGEIRRRLEV